MMIRVASLLFFLYNVDALSSSPSYSYQVGAGRAPPQERGNMPQPDRAMPPPRGAVEPGTYDRPAGSNWWDRAGNPGSHAAIKTSSGTFSTFTDTYKEPNFPMREGPEPTRIAGGYNQQATGSWWDRAGAIRSHESIATSAGTFNSYTEACARGPDASQPSTGNWWDSPGPIRSHDTINTSAGTFRSYTESCARGPEASQPSNGNWWDSPGPIRSHDTINTSAGTFRSYTESCSRGAGASQPSAGNWWDSPGPIRSHNSIDTTAGTFTSYTEKCARDAGVSSQPSAGNWWDNAGTIKSHQNIDTSAGFRTYTEASAERNRL